MGILLVVVGSAGLVVGLVAVAKGSLFTFATGSRRQSAWLVGVSLLLLGAGVLASQDKPTALRRPRTAATPEMAPSPDPGASLPQRVPADAQRAVVARNIDGDSIWVEMAEEGGPLLAGAVHKIRILEIDTPEGGRCFAAEAGNFARTELPVGSSVFLLADKEDKDRFGRYLRYVWKANGEFYNEKAVRQGYARAVLYMPNDRYIGLMRSAESEARAARRGLWGVCNRPATPSQSSPPAGLPPPPPPPEPGAAGPGVRPGAIADNCSIAYPDFCIAPPPPELDCADVAQKRFTVRPPDPHGFDRDGNGVGCEN